MGLHTRGWWGEEEDFPGLDVLGARRENELRRATEALGIRELSLLDYIDGELDDAPPEEVIGLIVGHLRRVRPQVVITFDPFGVYGHPDHIAICQLTTAATACAADPGYRDADGRAPHRVAKLYYMAATAPELVTYEKVFGELVMNIDGVEREAFGWPEWAITTRIDTEAYWEQVTEAVACHESQLSGYQPLRDLPEKEQRDLWCSATYYRAFSTVSGGRQTETDLFAGLRGTEE